MKTTCSEIYLQNKSTYNVHANWDEQKIKKLNKKFNVTNILLKIMTIFLNIHLQNDFEIIQ